MAWAITGTGMISSVGKDRATCFSSYCRGETGNNPLQFFDIEQFNLKRAYQITAIDSPEDWLEPKTRATKLLCAAINEAIRTAELLPSRERIVVLIGTGLRELRSVELWWANGQPINVNELHFGNAVRKTTGLDCQVMTFSNACSASNFALAIADDLLALNEVDAVVVAGCDSITESMFGLLDRVNPLHPETVQPFDRDRRGVVLGEGAAALVLESADCAIRRDVEPYAWLRGVGTSCDAFHETAPEKEGVIRAIVDAHQRANVLPGDINLLMVHGTGTTLNDQVEALAITEVFGDQICNIPITGLKSLIGHTSGASGLIGVVTAIECLNQGKIPPTVGLNNLMQDAKQFDFVESVRTVKTKIAQVNAFGFGGVNAVAILEKTS